MSKKQDILDYIENNKYDYVEMSHHMKDQNLVMKNFRFRTLIDCFEDEWI